MRLTWVAHALKHRACRKCCRALDDAEVIGIWLAGHRHSRDEPAIGYILRAMVSCTNCRDLVWLKQFPSESDLAQIAKDLYPLLPRLHMGAAVSVHVDARRRYLPPISDEEAARFMRLLARTSFRRGTKGLNQWLRRMGVESSSGN